MSFFFFLIVALRTYAITFIELIQHSNLDPRGRQIILEGQAPVVWSHWPTDATPQVTDGQVPLLAAWPETGG